MDKPKQIYGIKTPKGVFVSIFRSDEYSPWAPLTGYLVNGKEPKETFVKNWSKVDRDVVKLQKEVPQPSINHRFELIDKSMESEKIPAVLPSEEAGEHTMDGFIWKPELAMYESLYERKYDKQPPLIVGVPFTYERIAEVEEIPSRPFSFPVDPETSLWAATKTTEIGEERVRYSIVERLMLPPPLLPMGPCELSREDSYRIIRAHVKRTISAAAAITSDYDFCFTVEKRVSLPEPEEYTVDVNLGHNLFAAKGRKRKPKYETRYRKTRDVVIFEIAPKPYHEYPVVEPFKGKNREELAENIQRYLDELMEFINEPVVECSTCHGAGVLFRYAFEKKPDRKREESSGKE